MQEEEGDATCHRCSNLIGDCNCECPRCGENIQNGDCCCECPECNNRMTSCICDTCSNCGELPVNCSCGEENEEENN